MLTFQNITVNLGVSGAFGGWSGRGWRVSFQYFAVFLRNKWKVVRINEGSVQIIGILIRIIGIVVRITTPADRYFPIYCCIC
ncbi:hypothetical protein [Alkalihalophilus marmarensis]|uniref:hypothetical protein n=1 Tax=Alkalihalophilus marmarensis TaxID=521377 RepID=UPI002E245CE6|nr:hypothetical protein [Alkalihalophilus marmarensis]